MPIYEYKCNKCNNMFEILHKSSHINDGVFCPACNSQDCKKLISPFIAAGTKSNYISSGCDKGNCDLPPQYRGGCIGGMF